MCATEKQLQASNYVKAKKCKWKSTPEGRGLVETNKTEISSKALRNCIKAEVLADLM